MILVADSGSSKTDWLIDIPGQQPQGFTTAGINPYFLTEKEIIKILQSQCADTVKKAGKIDEIYFFGAGCSNPDKREMVSNALSHVFPKIFISVDTDLLGSAYATCGTEKGYCCVLGTGSNVSFFNGESIVDGNHGIGYVLGDEGSGTYFGKKLITDYLYGNMPADISHQFTERFQLDKEQVIKKVYQESHANTYLASFARFLSATKETFYTRELIEAGFTEFIETNIKTYRDHQKYKFHFVGSIAYHFRDILAMLCSENDIQLGKVIKQPITDLMEFVLTHNV
ncbi:N-acetylglucosamine kinase [Mucilaginibacter sp. HMF5004]|uniref:N-acetylglucosamine kinase n=1 Tax=Mucilaginibacter rivuli TaxID=2857527 RepID=UPI001C5E5D54|nr:N-acetylglucosamine kinase [Mucilaginibacter rivuli]MBW4891158.1 N-acetylglucosamine kinase [Mucilaginibacter rivuli]